MSLLRKIKKVFALLNPWPAKRSRRKVKRKSKKYAARRIRSASTGRKGRKAGNKRKLPKAISGGAPKKLKMARPPREKAAAKKKPKARSVKTVAAVRNAKAIPEKSTAKGPLPRLSKADPKKVMVGEVTHYFDRVKVGAFMITGAPVALGDWLEFKSRQSSFKQRIDSLQINRAAVVSARAGDEVGMLVKKPVKEGDHVFKML